MDAMIYLNNHKKSYRVIKCSVCGTKIKDPNDAFEYVFNLGVVCRKCRERFSKEDAELMVSLFIDYGGYFGKYKNSNENVESVIRTTIKKLKNNAKIELSELIRQTQHEAFLHGFTIEEFINGFKNVLDEDVLDE